MTTPKQEEFSNCTSQDGGNGTFYPKPGWVWQYPQPKLQTSNANMLMLSVIEIFHYLTFATQIGLAYAFFSFSNFYAPRCESFFLVAIAPVFQQAASVVPIMLHEYEGWQIAPFRESACDRDKFNNDELRRVAYKLLFAIQAVASGMFCIGVFGADSWSVGFLNIGMPWTILIIVLVLLWLYVAPRTTKSFSLTIDNKLVLPVPMSIAIVYIPIQIAYIVALASLLGWIPALLGVALPLLGGLMEGLGAESTFNQWWHLFAAILLSTSGLVLSFCVTQHAMGLL